MNNTQMIHGKFYYIDFRDDLLSQDNENYYEGNYVEFNNNLYIFENVTYYCVNNCEGILINNGNKYSFDDQYFEFNF